jgi:hypothetical protein
MESKEEKKVFRSRISILLLGFILAILIPCTIPMIVHRIIPGLYIMGGTLVFTIFIFTGMRYTVSGGKLSIKLWFFPYGNINIADIISVKRSYNPLSSNSLSSPATSLKRLEIKCRKGTKYPWMLISPVREPEFIEELKTVNPKINVSVPVSAKKRIWRVQDWDI